MTSGPQTYAVVRLGSNPALGTSWVTKPTLPRQSWGPLSTVTMTSMPLSSCRGTPATPLSSSWRAATVWLGSAPVTLTRTEFDILDVVSSQPRQALSRRQIIDVVWDPAWVGDEHVVDVHVANLRKKLEAEPSRPRHLITEPGMGYRFVP